MPKAQEYKPLELVTRRGVPIRYIDYARAEELLRFYQQLHAALDLTAELPPRDEIEAQNVLYFLSDRLERINDWFSKLLEHPCAVQVGGRKAVAMFNRIAAERAKKEVEEQLSS